MLGFIKKLPPDSALGRELAGDAAGVTLTDRLLAHQSTLLAGANWQRGGGKGSKPKPIKLPEPQAQEQTFTRSNAVERLQRLGLMPT